jgi:hypothetical protein
MIQVYQFLIDIEKLAGCTPAKVRGFSEWNSFLITAE